MKAKMLVSNLSDLMHASNIHIYECAFCFLFVRKGGRFTLFSSVAWSSGKKEKKSMSCSERGWCPRNNNRTFDHVVKAIEFDLDGIGTMQQTEEIVFVKAGFFGGLLLGRRLHHLGRQTQRHKRRGGVHGVLRRSTRQPCRHTTIVFAAGLPHDSELAWWAIRPELERMTESK